MDRGEDREKKDRPYMEGLATGYSTVHALGLVPASTIPKDGTGWYKPYWHVL